MKTVSHFIHTVRVCREETPPLTIEPRFGGWTKVGWHPGQDDEVVAYVRFEAADDHAVAMLRTLRIVELRAFDPWLRRLRDLPLSRIENAVHANHAVRFDLLQHIDEHVADPVQMFAMEESIKRGMSPRHQLERPATRRLGDDFYASVARAYADAVAWGMNPRKTLAADSGTPADTVARWIRSAREEGLLVEG